MLLISDHMTVYNVSMNIFGETLKRLRTEKGLSRQQIADHLHISRAGVANWEAGRRMPDANTIFQIAELLGVDTSSLLATAVDTDESPNIIVLDDEPVILKGEINVLQEAMPNANIIGSTRPMEVMDYIKNHNVALIFLDIDLGKTNGLDLCHELLEVSPHTNVIYLTAYREYSLDAWSTDACGFLLKPLGIKEVHEVLSRLRYPVKGLLY